MSVLKTTGIFAAAATFFVLVSPVVATSFGTGAGEPLPNVTSVNVYNTSGISSPETGGELVASGLNSTLALNQSAETRYRFTFRVENQGDTSWELNSSDLMFHEGLDPVWSVGSIWYNISSKHYTGDYSSGKVSWNTSQGGTLQPGQSMYANYLVNISGSSSEYPEHFLVNDTNNSAGSQDYQVLDLNHLGTLNVTITEPPNGTVLQRNRFFTVNATVECNNGECGNVTATPRYNESGSQVLIPQNSGTPFYTSDSRKKSCDNLTQGERCYVSWNVNATGSKDTLHYLDVNTSSSFRRIKNNESKDPQVRIDEFILMNLSWNTIDFGVIDPGRTDSPAQQNYGMGYNISIDPYSAYVGGLWLKGQDLVSRNNDNYSIGITNMSYSFQNDSATQKPLTHGYSLARSSISAGTVLNTFYWLDTPFGIIQSTYNGTITWKANSTG